MSDEKKQKIIVLDVLSYRGGNDEQERLGVEEIKWERLEEDKHITKSKHLDIIYKIIKILFDSSDGNMHLILSLPSQSRFIDELHDMANKYFSEYRENAERKKNEKWNRLIILVGSQTLFYYIGSMCDTINKVLWFAKEKSFFHLIFLNFLKIDQ